jgi:hypothetical protein
MTVVGARLGIKTGLITKSSSQLLFTTAKRAAKMLCDTATQNTLKAFQVRR